MNEGKSSAETREAQYLGESTRKSRIQRTVMFIAVAVGAAVFGGKYLFYPMVQATSQPLTYILVGTAFVSLGIQLDQIVFSIVCNAKLRWMMQRDFPKTVDEIRSLGVQTPLDFAYLMENSIKFCPVPAIGMYFKKDRCCDDKWVVAKSSKLFEEMFGRKPMALESGNWSVISRYETAAEMGKKPEEVTFENFQERVTEDFFMKLENENYFSFRRNNCRF